MKKGKLGPLKWVDNFNINNSDSSAEITMTIIDFVPQLWQGITVIKISPAKGSKLSHLAQIVSRILVF